MTDDHQPIRVPQAERPVPRYRVLLLLLLAAGGLLVLAALLAVLLLWFAHRWNVSQPILIGAGAGLFGALCVGTGYAVRSVVRHRFQFSLRALLIAMTVFALLLGTVGLKLLRFVGQQRAMWHVATRGAYVPNWFETDQNWLQQRYGYDPFADLSQIELNTDRAVLALLEHRDEFADLGGLGFGPGITDASLERAEELNAFPKLRHAAFYDTAITKRGMEQLANWRNLRTLFFSGGPGITDDSLPFLQKLSHLEMLTLLNERGSRAMPVTDAGMVSLGHLSHLKRLYLTGLPITDRGLISLSGLRNLEILTIRKANITQQGFEQLCTALPDCWITWDDRFVPGPVQVRRIIVWDIAGQEKQIGTVSQPETVAAIADLLNQPYQGGWTLKPPVSPPRFRLDFQGAHRCLCGLRFGNGYLQTVEYGRRRPMSERELQRLLELLGIPRSSAP